MVSASTNVPVTLSDKLLGPTLALIQGTNISVASPTFILSSLFFLLSGRWTLYRDITPRSLCNTSTHTDYTFPHHCLDVQGSRQECHSYYQPCCLCLWHNSSHPINLFIWRPIPTHTQQHSHINTHQGHFMWGGNNAIWIAYKILHCEIFVPTFHFLSLSEFLLSRQITLLKMQEEKK